MYANNTYAVCRWEGKRWELAGDDLRAERVLQGWPIELAFLPERFFLGLVGRMRFDPKRRGGMWKYRVTLFADVRFKPDAFRLRCVECGKSVRQVFTREWAVSRCACFINPSEDPIYGAVGKVAFVFDKFKWDMDSHRFTHIRQHVDPKKPVPICEFKYSHPSGSFPAVGWVLFCTHPESPGVEEKMFAWKREGL